VCVQGLVHAFEFRARFGSFSVPPRASSGTGAHDTTSRRRRFSQRHTAEEGQSAHEPNEAETALTTASAIDRYRVCTLHHFLCAAFKQLMVRCLVNGVWLMVVLVDMRVATLQVPNSSCSLLAKECLQVMDLCVVGCLRVMSMLVYFRFRIWTNVYTVSFNHGFDKEVCECVDQMEACF
jgi:hypothetical protein